MDCDINKCAICDFPWLHEQNLIDSQIHTIILAPAYLL